jgi:hypothetical protein
VGIAAFGVAGALALGAAGSAVPGVGTGAGMILGGGLGASLGLYLGAVYAVKFYERYVEKNAFQREAYDHPERWRDEAFRPYTQLPPEPSKAPGRAPTAGRAPSSKGVTSAGVPMPPSGSPPQVASAGGEKLPPAAPSPGSKSGR